jgi:hypothetical protein
MPSCIPRRLPGIQTDVAHSFDDIVATMKRCAAWLRDADVPFVLAGSVAAWARGGPAVCSDLDFVVRPEDAERALEVLAAQGLRIERPPEGWLVKAHDGEVLVDLIFDPEHVETDEAFADAETMSVMSVDLPVMSATDVVVTKLAAFEEHYIDFAGLLPVVRALREQIDWDAVRRRTVDRPIAVGFLAMVEALGVAPPLASPVRLDEERRIRISSA